MHIVMLSAEYPPRWGGMGSVVFHLAGHLVTRGHEVTVITRNGAGRPPSQEGVEVIEVGWARLPMAFTRSYGRTALRALKRLHRQKPVDVIHTHLPLISWTSSQFRKVQKEIAPVVSSLHGSWLGERDGMKLAAKYREAATWRNPNDLAILLTGGWYARYERAGVLQSAACVANSLATREDFIKRYKPMENWRCETVLWGVDHLVFHPLNKDDEDSQLAHEALRAKYGCADEDALHGNPETNTPLILAVGRLVARKGFLTLLRAMPAILAKNPAAKLVIVGRGHMKSKLMKQAKALGVAEALSIESGMPFADLAQLFRSADIVAYPSYYEGQGLIPLEAMSSGTPVVTVNHGPLPEMVDDSVGGLFQLGDASDLAKQINELLANPDEIRKMAELGRQRVLSSYTYEHNAKDFESIYFSVINR
jgi:glycosyltransferase involved in cell wall biosynthesis